MTSRTAHPWHITREEADCIEFDAEFDAYLKGGEVGALLRASYKVAGSAIEMDPKRAFTLAELTGARQATRGLRRCGARDPALVRSDAGAGREALKAIRLRARTNALAKVGVEFTDQTDEHGAGPNLHADKGGHARYHGTLQRGAREA
jgi:hypothetical protein